MSYEKDYLSRLRQQGRYRSLKPMRHEGIYSFYQDHKLINFCANDYLGLADHPRLKAAAIRSIEEEGLGAGSARLISGHRESYDNLERRLADWQGAERTLLFNSGYHANLGALPALCREGDVVFSDELNHASLIDGLRLARAETHVFRHHDFAHLEELLKAKRGNGKSWIVTESVFSMEGDVCDVEALLSLANKYDAFIYLDQAHAVGVLGKDGRGLLPHPMPENVVSVGTFGKAFGTYGAFISASNVICDYLINTARAFIFTTALPPAIVAATLAAFQLIQEEPQRRQQLHHHINFLGTRLRRPLFSPIISILIGGDAKTMAISQALFDQGYYVHGIRPPTVPEGTSRLRITLSTLHTAEMIDSLVEAIDSARSNNDIL